MAWAADLVDRLDPDADDRGEAVDDALLRLLSRDERGRRPTISSWASLFSAAALQRYPRPVAIECLRRVIERLQECPARRTRALLVDATREILDEESRQYSSGRVDLGVAHGVAAGRRLLGGICGAGVEQATVRPLLEGAVSWLGAFGADRSGPDLPRLGGTSLPAIAGPLCLVLQGPGIAAALMLAARGAGNAGWEQTAVALACRAAERPASETGAAANSHARLAHVPNRMYQATGEPTLGRAALYWLERTASTVWPKTPAARGREPGPGPAGTVDVDRHRTGRGSRRGRPGPAGCGHIRRAHLGPDVPVPAPRPIRT